MPFSRVLRLPGLPLFLLLIGIYGYFYQAGGANQNSRFDLVRSMVEEQTFQIDRYHRNTNDKAKRDQHYYTDKAPGVSWLGVPVHQAVVAVGGNSSQSQPSRYLDVSMYLVTLFAVAIPSALASVMLFILGKSWGLSGRASTALALSYGLGTLAFPYSTVFYGHQLAAALLLTAFVLLVRLRQQSETGTPQQASVLVVTGLLLGYAVVTEYPAALACTVLGIYAAVFVRPFVRLVWLAVGMALPGAMLAMYHNAAFGGPLILPYEFSTQAPRHLGFFMGIGVPDTHVLYQILLSSYRGLFYSSPWLLLSIPGALILVWQVRFRAEAIACIAIVSMFVWLNASLVDWEGGAAMGPRYLIPAIPFLVILAIGAWKALLNIPEAYPGTSLLRLPAGFWFRLAALVPCLAALGISLLGMLAGSAVNPQVSPDIGKPMEDVLYPLFFSGDLAVSIYPVDGIPFDAPAGTKPVSLVDGGLELLSPTGSKIFYVNHATNAGQLLGLDGLASLLPLAFYVLIVGGWLWRVSGQRPTDG